MSRLLKITGAVCFQKTKICRSDRRALSIKFLEKFHLHFTRRISNAGILTIKCKLNIKLIHPVYVDNIILEPHLVSVSSVHCELKSLTLYPSQLVLACKIVQ